MSLGQTIYTAVTGDAGVGALVAARCYPLLLPQYPTLPAITYQRISNSEQGGTTAIRRSRWQFDCWAATYAGAHELAALLKTALEEYSDTDQTPGIKMSLVANELDDYDPDTQQYRTIVDVFFITTGD